MIPTGLKLSSGRFLPVQNPEAIAATYLPRQPYTNSVGQPLFYLD